MHVFSCFFIGLARLSNNSWIIENDFTDASDFTIYIAAFYFHMVTMFSVGYGDIKAVSTTERIYINFFLVVGLFIYSTFLSVASTYFSRMDIKALRLNEKMKILNEINTQYHLKTPLFNKIKDHLITLNNQIANERYNLLETLPSRFSNELIYIMHKDNIKTLDFLKDQNHDFIIYILPKMKPVKIEKDELLFSYGEYIDEMYLVTKGQLSLEYDYSHYRLKVASIRKNYHFGEYQMSQNLQSNYFLSNKSKRCEVLVLKKSDFNDARLIFSENLDFILEKSKNLIEIIEKRSKLIESLFKFTNKYSEIKKLIKEIDVYILKKGFEMIYFEDVDFEQIKDVYLKINYEEILQNLQNNSIILNQATEMQARLNGSFRAIELNTSKNNSSLVNSSKKSSHKNRTSTIRSEKNSQSVKTKRHSENQKSQKIKAVVRRTSKRIFRSQKTLPSFLKNKIKKISSSFVSNFNNFIALKPANIVTKCTTESFSIQRRKKEELKIEKAFSVQIDNESTDDEEPKKLLGSYKRRATEIQKIASDIAKVSRNSAISKDYLFYEKNRKFLEKSKNELQNKLNKKKEKVTKYRERKSVLISRTKEHFEDKLHNSQGRIYDQNKRRSISLGNKNILEAAGIYSNIISPNLKSRLLPNIIKPSGEARPSNILLLKKNLPMKTKEEKKKTIKLSPDLELKKVEDEIIRNSRNTEKKLDLILEILRRKT